MFYQVRFQTGEIQDIVGEMKKGDIPCMDVDDMDELNWFINQLAENGIHKVEDIPYDKDARDKLKEPEFEFRIAFSDSPGSKVNLMYIDFYFPPVEDETYDSIFGD